MYKNGLDGCFSNYYDFNMNLNKDADEKDYTNDLINLTWNSSGSKNGSKTKIDYSGIEWIGADIPQFN